MVKPMLVFVLPSLLVFPAMPVGVNEDNQQDRDGDD